MCLEKKNKLVENVAISQVYTSSENNKISEITSLYFV